MIELARLTDTPISRSFELLQLIIDALPDAIFVKDLQHRWVAVNKGFCKMIGHPYEAVIGRSDPDFCPHEQAEVFWRGDDEVFRSGEPNENEEKSTRPDGTARILWTRKFPLRDAEGRVIGLSGIASDITPLKLRLLEAERIELENREQRTLIEAQTALLDQLAVPVIQLWEGILLLPLVGAISERRAGQVMESLLRAIRNNRAGFVILDVTGVPMMDTAVASYLIRAVHAAELLGCQGIMVGIGPEIAQTLVSLNVAFSRIITRGTLQSGLEYAMNRVNQRTALRVPR